MLKLCNHDWMNESMLDAIKTIDHEPGRSDRKDPDSCGAVGDSEDEPPAGSRSSHDNPEYPTKKSATNADRYRIVIVDTQADDSTTSTRNDNAIDCDWIAQQIRKAAAYLEIADLELTVCLLNNPAMSQVHETHSGVSGPTDVLTFDMSDDSKDTNNLNASDEPQPTKTYQIEIAIGIEVAQEQANNRGHPIEREVLLYVIHGILHCMGYDDHADNAFDQMHNKEDEVLQHIGVGSTFFDEPV